MKTALILKTLFFAVGLTAVMGWLVWCFDGYKGVQALIIAFITIPVAGWLLTAPTKAEREQSELFEKARYLNEYWLLVEEEKQGPFTREQIRSKWKRGDLPVSAQYCPTCWPEEEWRKVKGSSMAGSSSGGTGVAIAFFGALVACYFLFIFDPFVSGGSFGEKVVNLGRMQDRYLGAGVGGVLFLVGAIMEMMHKD